MADLRTRYLGMALGSPLVASSSPLTGTLDGLRRLEAAGAGAVVLPSLFEEDLAEAGPAAGAGPGGQARYGAGPGAYLSLVSTARASLSIPVVASLNGVSRGGWASSASRLEEAGASALELNIYYVSSRPGLSGSDVEWHYLDVVRAVRRAIGIPLAVKLSPYFSSTGEIASRLDEAGADGLVLFNRFMQPDIDLETLATTAGIHLSSPAEARLPRAWIALLRGQVRASLAATTGVEDADDVVKYLLAGADVVMTTSALLRHGPEHARVLLDGLAAWMSRKGFTAVRDLRGLLRAPTHDQTTYERTGYLDAIQAAARRYGPG